MGVPKVQLSYVYEYKVNEADCHVLAKLSFLFLLGAQPEGISLHTTVG